MFQSSSGTHRVRHRLRTTAQCLWLFGTPQRPLHRGGYRFELSIDPAFPQVPVSPAFALIPSRLMTRSKAILCGTGCALPIRPPGRTATDFHMQPGHTGISSSAPFHGRPTCPVASPHRGMGRLGFGLGRRGELHPPAPSVAQRARLEALRFSICLLQAWRACNCRVGDPTRPFGLCVSCSWRSARIALG